MNLAAVIESHARARPTHPAILFQDEVIDYATLGRRIRATAARLAAAGVGQGAVVGVGMADHPGHVIAMAALAHLGAVTLPLDHRWTLAEKTRMVEFFKPTLLLGEPGEAAIAGVPMLAPDTAAGPEAEQAGPPVATDGSLPLVLSLSSGTTGRPRGPLTTHGQMAARFLNQYVQLTFNCHDRYMSATPLYFGGGRTFSLSLLYLGGTLVMFPPPYKPEELVTAVARHRVNTLFLVPTLLRRLIELAGDSGAVLLPSLRVLLSSGAPLFPYEREAIRARLCPGFFEYYASTEGGGVSILSPADQERYLDSVGRAAFLVEIAIADDDHRELPAGEVGRIRYRGPGVAKGFYNEPDGGDAFYQDWFYPGDLGVLNAEGYLFLRGRKKDMIIRGGINIYPLEIEQTLVSHPAVADAAVVAWPSREFGEEVAAWVTLRAPAEAADLIAFCKERLAPYKVPRAVHFVDELPRNSSGKVLKNDLTARLPPL